MASCDLRVGQNWNDLGLRCGVDLLAFEEMFVPRMRDAIDGVQKFAHDGDLEIAMVSAELNADLSENEYTPLRYD